VQQCPHNWAELQSSCRQAMQLDHKLALNYQATDLGTNREILEQLVGIAKYLATAGTEVGLDRLQSKLNISDRSVRLGLDTLIDIGFQVSLNLETQLLTVAEVQTPNANTVDLTDLATVNKFFAAIDEERFNRNYFLQIPAYAIG
jgi:single-stranded-DNA-specific exonuclease